MPLDGTNFEIPAVTQTLLAARQRLVDFGWVQNHGKSRHGYCMSFAVEGGPDARMAAAVYLSAAIDDLPLIPWNDAPGRTKEEVLEAVDRAIALSMTGLRGAAK